MDIEYRCRATKVGKKFTETRQSWTVSICELYEPECKPSDAVIALVKGILFPKARPKKKKTVRRNINQLLLKI